MARQNVAARRAEKQVRRGTRGGWAAVALMAVAVCGGAVLSGCAGFASNGNPTPQATVQISPAAITFSNVATGQKSTQSATLTNTGQESVTISGLSVSSSQFTASGIATPMALAPGQSAMFQVVFVSNTAGTVSGTLSAMTAHGGNSTHVKLNGSAGTPKSTLSMSAASLNFGSVLVNGTSTQAVTLTNSGASSVQINQIGLTGAGFSVSGITAPLTIQAGQSAALQVSFVPTAAGAVTGGITNVNTGSSATQSVKLSNSGNSNLTVTQLAASGAGISVSGLTTPLLLTPLQSATFTVTYAPTTGGATTGGITVTNNDGVSTVAAVTGTGVQPALSVTPATANFSVLAGNTSSQTVQLKNSGTANLTISQATVSGSGFSASGLTLPLTLTPGQSGSFSVQYAPQVAGNASGSISIVSNAPNSPGIIALSGTSTAATSTMSLTPTSISFGNVNTGSIATQNVQLANTGNSSVTVTQVAVSGAGVSVSGATAPFTIAPSQSVPLTIRFTPTTSGAMSGSVTVTNNSGGSIVETVTGTGTQAGLSVTPASASFGSVVTGNTNSQTIQLTNNGNANLLISQATVSGTGFSLSGLALPLTLTPGQSGAFNVQFAPQGSVSATGSVSIVSNAPSSPATVTLSGTGLAASYTLAVNPGSLSYGTVTDGSSAAQSFTVTNTGNANVAITGVSVTGAEYAIASGAGAVTLSPNQSTAVSVQFAPTIAGSATGTVKIASNATGGTSSVSLSGTGAAPVVSHTAALGWGASSSTVAGYNVYRSTTSGSAYVKVNGSLVGAVSYADSSVQSGQTYYYVATAVDGSGNESVFSNEVAANIP